jgi:hypothetical protein
VNVSQRGHPDIPVFDDVFHSKERRWSEQTSVSVENIWTLENMISIYAVEAS